MAEPIWVNVPWETNGGHYDDLMGHVSYDGGVTWEPGGSAGGDTYTPPAGAGGTAPGGAAPGGTARRGGGGSSGGGGGGSSSNYTIEVDPVSGRRYRANNGVFVSWMDPAPSTPSAPASLWNDMNGDGYDDQTGLPLGVTSIGGKLYFQGQRVNPDGSLMTAAQIAAEDAGSASAPRTWTGYGPKGQGTYYLDGPGGTPGTYLGPTTAAGAGISSGGGSSSGGSSSGGGSSSRTSTSSSSTTHSGGYTNVNISDATPAYIAAQSAPRYNYNTSDIGPNSMANSAADRAQQAAQFAQTYGLNAQKANLDRAATYAQLLQTIDPAAYAAFLREGGGDLQNAIGTGGNAISENALRPAAMLLGQGGLTPGGPGPGIGPAGGGGPTSPGATGGGGTPPAGAPGSPAAAPADTSYDYWLANVYKGPPADGTRAGADPAYLQYQYNAWKAALPAPAPAPPVGGTPTPGAAADLYAQFGNPPDAWGSWQDWAMANVPALQQLAGAGKGSVDLNDPVVFRMISPYIISAVDASSATPEQQAIRREAIARQAAGWPISTLQPEVRAARYLANVPGSAQWNNNLKPGDMGYRPMSPGAYIGGGQYAPAAPATVNTGGGTAANPSYNTISPPTSNYPGTAGTGYNGSGLPEDVYYGAHSADWTNPATGKTYPATNPAPKPHVQIAGGLPVNTTPLGVTTNPTAPLTATSGTGFHAGDPNYRYDPTTGTYVHLAYGGMTRAPMMVTGDPQRDGRPNPEVISNPTGAPISVMPMRDMQHMMPNGQMMAGPPMPNAMAMQNAAPQARFMRPPMLQDLARQQQYMMRRQRMGGLMRLPRYAYGTTTAPSPDVYNGGNAPLPDLSAFNRGYTQLPAPTAPAADMYTGSMSGLPDLSAFNSGLTLPAGATVNAGGAATPTAPLPTTGSGGYTTMPIGQTYYETGGYYDPNSPNFGGTTLPGALPNPGSSGGGSVRQPTTTYGGATTGGTTAPVTGAGGTAPAVSNTQANPMAPVYNNPYFNQALYDRLSASLPAWAQGNPYAFMLSNYDQYDPTERNLYEQYLQTAKGIPISSTQFAANKNRLGGLSRAALSLGY